MTPVPVVVLGGGLGCGKTTLLLHLLANASGRRLALVINEFGDLGIDGALLAGAGAPLIELSNGCVCCATGGDLVASVHRLLQPPLPDAIVVELSGVADPYPVLRELALLARRTIRRVVSIVDLETDPAGAPGDTLMLRRLDAADAVVLNKEDRTDPARVAAWRRLVATTNPSARVHATRFGQLPLDAMLEGPTDGRPLVRPATPAHAAYRSVTLTVPQGLTRRQLEQFLEDERGVERAKGFVRLREGAFVVQAVRGVYALVPSRPENSGAPWDRLVCIGPGLDEGGLRRRAAARFAPACTQGLVHNPPGARPQS